MNLALCHGRVSPLRTAFQQGNLCTEVPELASIRNVTLRHAMKSFAEQLTCLLIGELAIKVHFGLICLFLDTMFLKNKIKLYLQGSVY